ncbi:hypothetical protein KKC45_03530 [Patescibacteria group bacterium]|nr:hypothetical protein [Patescibacteria group bacterium]
MDKTDSKKATKKVMDKLLQGTSYEYDINNGVKDTQEQKIDKVDGKRKFNKNPLVWFFAAIILGWWAVETGNFEFFTIFISAVILSKQIEIISK